MSATAAGSGPVNPIPDTLWQPPADSVPVSGNYVYLDSEPGDYIGDGQQYLYTPANSMITVSESESPLWIRIRGYESWSGHFQPMSTITKLEPGYYPGVTRWPFHDPAMGGLDWSGEGRGSNDLTGWFVVDSVTYTDGVLTAFDLRFEQHSAGRTPALHGAIHWRADDPTQPSGPVNPIPDTLWQPSAGATPSSGNYVYLESDAGDNIGAGQKYLYTSANADITISANGGHLAAGIDGNESWQGNFQTMDVITQLQPGYYPGVRRYSLYNPAIGGLDWSGEGRSSRNVTGWFVVDSATYAEGVLTAIDLRFEQHCEGALPALHGAIHWRADDPPNAADNIPGDPLPASPAMGRVDATGRTDDVFRISLRAGQTLQLELNGDDALDAYLFIYGPDATDVWEDDPIAGDTRDGYPKGGTFRPDKSGTYYIDMYAFSGAGDYSLKWHIIDTRPVWRFYNMKTGTHFYTASESEKNNVAANMAGIYSLDGVGYSVNGSNPANGSPLYRFYNMKTGTHFYTVSESEKNNVLNTMQTTFRLEGVAYNVSSKAVPGATVVWRFYNLKTGTHFYTADPAEKARVISTMGTTYSLDGAGFYLAP